MNAFTLYPAIDMRNGKCVRLIQGDYGKETIYGDSPLDMAAQFAHQNIIRSAALLVEATVRVKSTMTRV